MGIKRRRKEKTVVVLTADEIAILNKYGIKNRDIAEYMSLSEVIFNNSTAKDRYKRGVARVVKKIEDVIKERIKI